MISGMILVFGGTTEGRKAVEVLEKAGNAYYYSTKTGEQDITLQAAINKAPREMIRKNLQPFGVPLTVTISVPQGAEIARRTFNPRLGIEGGISIIGVSGIVELTILLIDDNGKFFSTTN